MHLRKKLRYCVLETAASVALATQANAMSFAVDWGSNTSGQLGNGTTINGSSPAIVTSIGSGANAVASGMIQNFAAVNGCLYGWGKNQYGQLGIGYANSTNPLYVATPTPVIGLSSGVTAVASGATSGVAIQNGAAFSWGGIGGLPTPAAVTGMSSGVTAVANGVGDDFAIQNGALFAWGNNSFQQLGTGSTAGSVSTPAPVVGLSSGISQVVSAAGNFSLAIKNGALYGWGVNSWGQLGNGNQAKQATPVPVYNLSSGVTSAAAGGNNSMALQNGTVYVCGADPLFFGTYFPLLFQPVSGINGTVVSVATTGSSDYALASDGSIWDWGDNSAGQLGLGNSTVQFTTPQHLNAPAGYACTSISAGGEGGVNCATIAILARPDAAVSTIATYTPLGNVTPIGTALTGYAISNLSVPPGTSTGSIQIAGNIAADSTGTEVVFLGLADPTQAAALVADLTILYGPNYASVLGNDPFDTPYQVELFIPATAATPDFFNFDFSTVVNAGPGGNTLGSVQIVNVGVVPEPTSALLVAAGAALCRRKKRMCGPALILG